MRESDELIIVGKISGTHGIRGDLKVYSFSGNLESLQTTRSVTLKYPDGTSLHEHAISSVRPHGPGFIVKLQGFENINQVEPLIGSEICLRRSQLPEPDDDEYYWCDLLGLKVLTIDGTELGRIEDIFETGSNDVYVVRGNSREYLIPAIANVVTHVDIAAGIMTITPLDGLLDL